MAVDATRLSKSRFTAGLQCHKQLWWRVHEPDAPELVPDEPLRALFDQGIRVGQAARAYVPGGRLIDFPHHAIPERVAATRAALAAGERVLYEASFIADRVFAAVDILERRGDGYDLIEVKSSTQTKDEHVPDAAIQAHVLRQAGLAVERVEIMHLNRACAYPDLGDLFACDEVTAQVEAMLPEVPGLVREQLAVLAGPLPDAPIGEHCDKPYECPFKKRCWPERPEHHVRTLYYGKSLAAQLEAQGYVTIAELPAGLRLHPAAERQRRAVQSGRLLVEGDLRAALRAFRPPIAYIDFETVAPAIPVWTGCHPYDPVPAQFTCIMDDGSGNPRHHGWLAAGPGDPRPELVARLAEACRGARLVVAYYADFERRCLRLAADALPQLRAPVQDILDRLVDPLPAIREHVYDPKFGGSFSLKSVLPALVPELSYEGLEIPDGMVATVRLARLLFEDAVLAEEEKARLREELTSYCQLDTWGMVKLVERLHELGAGMG